MIEIDGEYGSGGGQILRTACGLSALTMKPCEVFNIRAKRPKPGLREQHLQAIKAVAELAGGILEGADIASTRIRFFPREITERSLKVQVATAGSVGLVIQALLIPSSLKGSHITIEGGATFGLWAPPAAYLQSILSPLLEKMGFSFRVEVLRDGFYPRGGALVRLEAQKASFRSATFLEKGQINRIGGLSVASIKLKDARVAHRQAEAAREVLKEHYSLEPEIEVSYCSSLSPGSGLQLFMERGNAFLGASSIGERGKRAEEVGREAARGLIEEDEGGVVDSHAADQLLPFLAFAGGKVKVSKITQHCLTNAYVIERFLPVRFSFQDRLIEAKRWEDGSVELRA